MWCTAHLSIYVQYIQCATFKILHIYSQAALSSLLKVQACDFSCDTDVHAPAESPTLSAGTHCNEAERKVETSTSPFMSNICLASHPQNQAIICQSGLYWYCLLPSVSRCPVPAAAGEGRHASAAPLLDTWSSSRAQCRGACRAVE